MQKKFENLLLLLISLVLFSIPFFWFKSGEFDLGGDSNRLYFYDPISFLQNASIYPQMSDGTGLLLPAYYHIPFISLLAVIHYLLPSTYLIGSLFNGIKLLVGFLAVYFISAELLKREGKNKMSVIVFLASTVAGLFYVFAPSMTGNMERALLSHNQMFLNPLIFFLLLKYLTSKKFIYAWSALGVSVLFSPNFGFPSGPAFFAFYPLALLFLLFYIIKIKKQPIPFRQIILVIFLFIGLQAFQLVPQVSNLFDTQSYINSRVFDSQTIAHEGVQYFIAVLPLASPTNNFFYTIDTSRLRVLLFFAPFIILVGLVLNKSNRTLLLTAIFFLITFFLMTAKITTLGMELYKDLFYIPGFSMFRNFFGQWQFVYTFFFSLLFGQCLFIILTRISSRRIQIAFVLFVIGILLISNRAFLLGTAVKKIVSTTGEVHTGFSMDPRYEEVLSYIKSIPYNTKILTLPFTDCCYQVLYGPNNSAYMGPSTISHLTGKSDFSGYQLMMPFSEMFLKFSREHNYKGINGLLGILGIEYIFHNSDEHIYNMTFPKQPYEYVRQSLPNSQKEYTKLIVEDLHAQKKLEIGPYNLYDTFEEAVLPHIYLPDVIHTYTTEKQFEKKISEHAYEKHTPAYLSKKQCNKILSSDICKKNSVAILGHGSLYFQKINPTKYLVKVRDSSQNTFIVFSESYNPNWKLFPTDTISSQQPQRYYPRSNVLQGKEQKKLDMNVLSTLGKTPINEKNHVLVNEYANGWFLSKDDLSKNSSFILELTSQRTFYFASLISIISLIVFILIGILSLKNKFLL